MEFNRLPLEVLQIILWLVPRDSLVSVSLVSKSWRSITLPLLFESINYSRHWSHTSPDGFLRRIIDEPDADKEVEHVVRLFCFVKRLSSGVMDEEMFRDFGSVVVKMKNLERLDWEVSALGEIVWYPTLVDLYRELPKLRTLNLTMAQNEIALGQSSGIVEFNFPNLRELSIKFDGLVEEEPDEELPSSIIELIRGARNVESLSLAFEEDDESGAALWGSVDVFSQLASDHFPNLRRLEISSRFLVPIDNFSGPEFRQFLQNHSQLQKIVLLTDGYDNSVKLRNPPPLIVTPTMMEEMMPSIRHFAGPGMLLGALLKSGLAGQVELLELHEPAASELGDLSSLLPDLDDPSLPELSSLKGLAYFMNCGGTKSDWETIIDGLSSLAPRMPMLQELIISPKERPGPDELHQLIPILEQFPDLRSLVVRARLYDPNEGRDAANQRFYEGLDEWCPLLDIQIGGNDIPAFSLALE